MEKGNTGAPIVDFQRGVSLDQHVVFKGATPLQTAQSGFLNTCDMTVILCHQDWTVS
jgi:hypothetical protein